MNIGKQNKASPSMWEKVWKAGQEQSYPASNLGTEAAVVHVTGLEKGEKRVSGTATCPSLSHITKKCLCVFPLHGPRLFLLVGTHSSMTVLPHHCLRQEPAGMCCKDDRFW